MSSRQSPAVVIDQYDSGPSTHLLSLLPPRLRPGDVAHGEGHRRTQNALLPALTTNIPSGPSGSHIPTPLSTTSLSSPFMQNNLAYSPSPGNLSRGVSPMASRPTYNVPYNPSEWTTGSRRTSQNEGVNRNPEDRSSPPPPPYSPPKSRSTSTVQSAGLSLSPAQNGFSSGSTSQINTPNGSLGTISPNMPFTGHLRESPVSSMMPTSSSSVPYIPPPPARRPAPDHRQSNVPHRMRPMSVSSLSQVMTMPPQLGQERGPYITSNEVEIVNQPPAAKRAASAGAVSTANSSSQSRDQSEHRSASGKSGWQPGMPLPGPPPGPPPPSSSRSQSASATSDNYRKASPGPSTRPHTLRAPFRAPLSPMPPTPAGWTEDQPLRPATRSIMPLQIRTTNLDTYNSTKTDAARGLVDSNVRPGSSGSGLVRQAAIRDTSVKGLRERRNHRRSMNEQELGEMSALSISTNSWVDGIMSASSTNQSTADSTESPLCVTDQGQKMKSSSMQPRITSSEITASPLSQPDQASSSPPLRLQLPSHSIHAATHMPTKALPTPPLSQKAPLSAQDIPTSSSSSLLGNDENDAARFATEASHRYQDFLQSEQMAASDEKRLRLFCDFIIKESALRRNRYASAFAANAFNVERIRERLFIAQDAGRNESQVQTPTDGGQMLANMESKAEGSSRPEQTWWKDYRPALSPIASMSNDEMSSRGRTPSRWWESQNGSQNEDGPGKLRRSKRESKYMGLSAVLMQSTISEADTPTNFDYSAHTYHDQYPEEKANPQSFGFYDDTPSEIQGRSAQPNTPGLLDFSRFITLPPPYPRHHPAVNNSHPQLATFRNTVRSLSNMSEVKVCKSRQALRLQQIRSEYEKKVASGRIHFQDTVQSEIAAGSITYADAAQAEAALRIREQQAENDCVKAEFDMVQEITIKPLNNMLNDRLAQLSSHISELTEKLFLEAQRQDPDGPQLGGDDTPELLEYLTQLKWLFETREQVHKEIFDLVTERNEKYRVMVLLPYRHAKNHEKLRFTEEFFDRDSMERKLTFCKEALTRHEQFYNIIEDNVIGGVEAQSSAFWDIAPPLATLLQEIPLEIQALDAIAIPEQEYRENPSYYQYPQQYIYTLLEHAEKSTYQFIESQINLYCLLHEVRRNLLLARCKCMEAQKSLSHGEVGTTYAEVIAYQTREEQQLTAELKQKVSMIEEQWVDALGGQVQTKQEQVKSFLQIHGGWEDLESSRE